MASCMFRCFKVSVAFCHNIVRLTAAVCRTTAYHSFVANSHAFFACTTRFDTRLILSSVLGFSLFATNTQEQKANVTTNSQEDNEIILLLKKAKLAERRQELERADELYHRALGLVNINQQQKIWTDDQVVQARVYIYDSMANLAFLRGRLEAAEKLFKQTIQGILQQGTRQDDNSIVEISLKLAMIYAVQKRVTEAEYGYQFCIKTQEHKIKNNKDVDDDTFALLGMSVDAYSRFLVVQKHYAAALTNLNKALVLAVSVLGENHQQVAVLLNDIATVASLTDNFDLACHQLEHAIEIAERIDLIHLPTLYCNLAAVYVHRSDFNKARVYYDKAIKLADEKHDSDVRNKAQSALRNLSQQS